MEPMSSPASNWHRAIAVVGNHMARERVEESDDEDLLVESARAGDPAAFAELVARYQDEVFTLALRLVRDRSLAADVAQEAMVRAYRSIASFRGQAAFSTWLHRITVNTAWTQLDRARRRQADPLDEVAELPAPSLAGDPVRAAESVDLRARLSAAVAALPPDQRAVVVLKDVYGWSHAEIAEELSVSVTATKVRLHRAHQRLRGMLKGELT